MAAHEMRLDPAPFRMIKRGEKTIELRLYDEKRRKIAVGARSRLPKRKQANACA